MVKLSQVTRSQQPWLNTQLSLAHALLHQEGCPAIPLPAQPHPEQELKALHEHGTEAN